VQRLRKKASGCVVPLSGYSRSLGNAVEEE
jgi:hypothetical protein